MATSVGGLNGKPLAATISSRDKTSREEIHKVSMA
jgi:hypothetical protein